jgi:hypothetical protein
MQLLIFGRFAGAHQFFASVSTVMYWLKKITASVDINFCSMAEALQVSIC